ncbi:hypothetical protein P9112_007570 [Eukaryota sp. TZLM1-RC]
MSTQIITHASSFSGTAHQAAIREQQLARSFETSQTASNHYHHSIAIERHRHALNVKRHLLSDNLSSQVFLRQSVRQMESSRERSKARLLSRKRPSQPLHSNTNTSRICKNSKDFRSTCFFKGEPGPPHPTTVVKKANDLSQTANIAAKAESSRQSTQCLSEQHDNFVKTAKAFQRSNKAVKLGRIESKDADLFARVRSSVPTSFVRNRHKRKTNEGQVVEGLDGTLFDDIRRIVD